jgi:hypothetical protein
MHIKLFWDTLVSLDVRDELKTEPDDNDKVAAEGCSHE